MQHSSTPSLFRAVAECTQPYGPPASGSSVRALQSYLTNDRCVDSVYRAVLARACAEPQSEAVISKCIALIKQYVSRHSPSPAVLEAIAVACQRLADSLPPESGLQKSLVYLESSVARLAGSTHANRRMAQLQSSGSPRPWLHAAGNGDSTHRSKAGGSVHSMHSSMSEDTAAAAAAGKPGSPVRGSVEELRHTAAAGQFSEDEEALPAVMDAVREVGPEPCLPEWTFQPSALQELWGQPLDAAEEHGDLDWSLLLPHYSPSLVPLVEGLPGMEVLHMLSSHDIIYAITDAGVETQLRQMREIAEVRRMQAGVTPELLQSALQQSRNRRARRLFQPLPYMQQEHIDVSSADVAAVVEIMCGKPSPAAPSAIMGTVGLDDPTVYWQQRAAQPPQQQQQPLLMLYQQPAGQQQQQHHESIGQISSCILVKLIVDLWLSAGGEVAFPLVLRMLQQALYQAQPEYRVHAFNIIYNLALHGCMLLNSPTSHPPSPAGHIEKAVRGHTGGGSSLLQHHQQLQQQQQQLRYPQQQQQQQQFGMLQRLRPTANLNSALDAAAAAGSVGSAGGAAGSPAGSIGGGGSEHQGSPGTSVAGSLSPLPSPKIHLPPQLLGQQQQQQQQQPPSPLHQQLAAAGQLGSSTSPLSSPKARSRLSRSELRINAEQLTMQQLGTRSEQQQLGSSFIPAAGTAAEEEAAAAGQSDAGSAAGSVEATAAAADNDDDDGASARAGSSEELLPVEVAWEAWLQQLLYELLLMLSMVEEPCEDVWQAAVGCLLQLTTHAGHWVAASLSSLPPAAAAVLLDACVTFHWSSELHAHLVQMAVNLLYLTEPVPAAAPAASGGGAVADGDGIEEAATAAAGAGAPGCCSPAAGRGRQQQAGGGSPVRGGGWVRSPGRRQQQQQQHWRSPPGTTDAVVALPLHEGDEQGYYMGLDDTSSNGSSRRSRRTRSRSTTAAPAGLEGLERLGQDPDDAEYVDHDDEGGSSCYTGEQHAEFDLPCQLHAGPVDEQQLEAFGGPQKLLKHFCHAASIDAQRTLLVPLLQVLMPPDAPDAAQLAILQALCSNPNCLAVLQATLSAGLPGWADPILAAVTQLLDDQGLDLQLLAAVLLRLEDLAVGQLHAAAAADLLALGQPDHGVDSLPETLDPSAAAAARASSNGDMSSSAHCLQELAGNTAAATLGVVMQPEVEAAMQVTLQQLAGQLPAQPQVRPGPQGSGGTVVYQVPAEVQGSWKALKALCWCDDELARGVARQWLQRLLALTLKQALQGTILLPLPGVKQRTAAAPAASGSSSGGGAASGSAAATTAAINAACESWVDVLAQLVSHCQKGPDTLVDALQLHITYCKLQLGYDLCDSSTSSPLSAAAAAAAAAMPSSASAAAPGSRAQQQQQRAAVARVCVQAWAFVCQWVMQAKASNSQAALTRLASIAQSLACVPDVPDWLEVLGGTGGTGTTGAAAAAAADLAAPAPAGGGPTSGRPDREAADCDIGDPSAAAAAADGGRDEDAAYRGVPPPEPSSEPSALAALWAAEGRDATAAAASAARQGTAAWGCSPEAAAAAVAAAEAVCWPQAFLLGRALLPQQMAAVLSGASLALLLVRLLQCKPPSRAADRGFHGRPSSSSSAAMLAAAPAPSNSIPSSGRSGSTAAGVGLRDQAAAAGAAASVLPCPVLYPWSDGRQDLQLGLLLMLMSSCSSEAENFAEFGLEAVTQQVLSRCTDPRGCLLVSQFMLEHLMRHQQERYWAALRQLVTAAQQADDERLLGNPFLQLITLLSQQQSQQQQQQKQQGGGGRTPEVVGAAGAAGSSGRGGLGLGLGMGWSNAAAGSRG